jgi:hypothetical protein
MLIVDIDADCEVQIALRIEGVARPMFGSGWLELEDKPVPYLLVRGARPNPSVDCVNRRAARFDDDTRLALAASRTAEIRRFDRKR